MKVQAYHSAVLGSDEKQLQAVQAGKQEFYIGTLAPLNAKVKEVAVWDLPFLFANTKEVYAVLDGKSSKKIFEKIEPAGLVGLTWTGMGFRNLSNSKRSVNKIEDVSGLKVRVMANPVALETWKAIGANAVPRAGNTSANAMGTALAPMAFQVSRATGLAITRIFRPLMSSSLVTVRLLLDRLRKPMPVQVRPTRPAGSSFSKIFLEDLPSSTA